MLSYAVSEGREPSLGRVQRDAFFFVFSDVLESESELLVLSVLMAQVLDRF